MIQDFINIIIPIHHIIIDDTALPIFLIVGAIIIFFCGVFLNYKIQSFLRIIAIIIICVIITSPQIKTTTQQKLTQYIIIAHDISPSHKQKNKQDITQQYDILLNKFITQQQGDYQLLHLDFAKNKTAQDLATTLKATLRHKRADQIASVFIISDGLLHDESIAPDKLANLWQEKSLKAPIYFIFTGDDNQQDNILQLVDYTPAITRKDNIIATYHIDGNIPIDANDVIEFYKNQSPLSPIPAQKNRNIILKTPIEKARDYLITAKIPVNDNDNTKNNNHNQFITKGLQTQLRVLMLSDAPHPTMRIWRNLIKSDPYVILEHYAVLRDPKQQYDDNAKDLALIPFPSEELFFERLSEFDLIILDRIYGRGLITYKHFQELERYVDNGGALLTILPDNQDHLNGLINNIGNLDILLTTTPMQFHQQQQWYAQPTSNHPVINFLYDSPPLKSWQSYVKTKAKNTSQSILHHHNNKSPILLINQYGQGRRAQLNSTDFWRSARASNATINAASYQQLLRQLIHWLLQFSQYDYPQITWQPQSDDILRVIIEQHPQLSRDDSITVINPMGDIFSYNIIQDNNMTYADITTNIDGYYHIDYNNISDKIYHKKAMRGDEYEPRLKITNQSLINNIIAISHGKIITPPINDIVLFRFTIDDDIAPPSQDDRVIILDQRPIADITTDGYQRFNHLYFIVLLLIILLFAWFLEKKRL